jgi:hypothetical protein
VRGKETSLLSLRVLQLSPAQQTPKEFVRQKTILENTPWRKRRSRVRHHKDMPSTGETREITARVNAKEAEKVQQVSETGLENKAALRKQGREGPGAKRQSTEGPISRTYSLTPISSGDGEGPRETEESFVATKKPPWRMLANSSNEWPLFGTRFWCSGEVHSDA